MKIPEAKAAVDKGWEKVKKKASMAIDESQELKMRSFRWHREKARQSIFLH